MDKWNPRMRQVLHHIPTIFSAFPNMFSADMSNRTTASLFPRVTGNHAKTSYSLEHAVGTITQIDNRIFDKGFDGHPTYPTNQRVSSNRVCLKGRV